MATQNSTGFKTFQATAVAIEEGVRVTLDANGLISAAAAASTGIGVTVEAIAASGYGTVKLFTGPGTFLIQAAGPVTRGAALYSAAAGEVDDTGTYRLHLVAGEAATAQGDLIECVPNDNITTTVGTYVTGDIGTIAAAGNSQATATAVTKMVTYVTAGDDTKGIVLPTAVVGAVYEIVNTVSNKHVHCYPAVDEYINEVQNTGVTIASGSMARFICTQLTKWHCLLGV